MSRRVGDGAPLRVLLVDHTASLGGGELALARLVAALDPADVQARVVVLDDGPLVERLRSAGVQVDVVALREDVRTRSRDALGPLSALLTAAAVVPFVLRLARFVREAGPDVVHTNSLKADLLGSLAAGVARVPVVWHVHDRIADDYLPARVARIFRVLARWWPRAVVANSLASAATLDRPGTVVAYPGFSPDQARASAARTEPEPPVVGLVGRISPTKGQLELVRAARTVLDARPDVRFRLVGSPMFGAEDYAAEVEREIARRGLGDAFELRGFRADVAAEIDALTVLVHASPVPEPFGQVVVEAMVRGVPVIATDAGGVPEILRDDDPAGAGAGPGPDGLLGTLVPPGDPGALADALIGVLGDPEDRRARAAAAHESACRRFAVARTAATVTDVWRDVAAGRRRARRA